MTTAGDNGRRLAVHCATPHLDSWLMLAFNAQRDALTTAPRMLEHGDSVQLPIAHHKSRMWETKYENNEAQFNARAKGVGCGGEWGGGGGGGGGLEAMMGWCGGFTIYTGAADRPPQDQRTQKGCSQRQF
jgi:hypothetical protein